jgi:hypothetical protein
MCFANKMANCVVLLKNMQKGWFSFNICQTGGLTKKPALKAGFNCC